MVKSVDLSNHQYIMAMDKYCIVSATDKTGRINYVNERFCEISGYSKDELLGASSSIVNSGFHSKEFFKELWSTISNGQNWFGVIRNRKKDGSDYWVHAGIFPLKNQEGKITGYFSLRTDISDTFKRKNEIKDYRNRLNSFFNSSRDINLLIDPDLKILAFNSAAQKYVESYFSRNLNIGDSLLDFVINKNDITNCCLMALAGEFVSKELQTNLSEGTSKHMELHFSPAHDDEGHTIGVAFNAHDITKRKKYEIELEHRAKLLEQISMTQSHQVRGPVATCLGLINLIKKENINEDNKMLIEMLEKSLHLLDQAIKGVVNKTYLMNEVN